MDHIDAMIAEDSQSWRNSVDRQMPEPHSLGQPIFVPVQPVGGTLHTRAGLAGVCAVLVLMAGVAVAIGVAREHSGQLAGHSQLLGGFGASVTPQLPPPCVSSQSGFGLSIAPGVKGARTPIAAARRFEVTGQVHGYGDRQSTWVVASITANQATLKAGRVTLQAVKVKDGGWIVASGKKGTTC
jgi:hypothetical protein